MTTAEIRIIPSEAEKEYVSSDAWAREQEEMLWGARLLTGVVEKWEEGRDIGKPDYPVAVETHLDPATLVLDIVVTGGARNKCLAALTAFFG